MLHHFSSIIVYNNKQHIIWNNAGTCISDFAYCCTVTITTALNKLSACLSRHTLSVTSLTSPITVRKAVQPTCTRSPTAAAIPAAIMAMAGAGAASPPTKPTNRTGPEKLRCCSEFLRHSLALEYRRGRMKDSLCFLADVLRDTFHHFNWLNYW